MNLLMAAVLLLQDKSAEETFKKIEEVLERASTFSVKYRLEGASTSGKERRTYTADGTILLKENLKVCASRRVTVDGAAFLDWPGDRILCDGARLLLEFPERKVLSELDANVPYVARFKAGLLRVGAASTIGLAAPTGEGENKRPGGLLPKEDFNISELREGPKGERGKTLAFTLNYDSGGNPRNPAKPYHVILGYDPATWKLINRTVKVKGTQSDWEMRETYEEFTLNADIPEETFKIPEEKK